MTHAVFVLIIIFLIPVIFIKKSKQHKKDIEKLLELTSKQIELIREKIQVMIAINDAILMLQNREKLPIREYDWAMLSSLLDGVYCILDDFEKMKNELNNIPNSENSTN
jgi:hypothetical protein